MTGKKKLLIIVPTLRLGGQERVATITAHILKEAYDVLMVVFDYRNSVFTPECEVIDLKVPAVPGMLRKLLQVIRRVIALRKLKKEHKVDISISFGQTANFVNVLSARKEKTVSTLRAFLPKRDSLMDRIIYQKSNCIGTCSAVIAESLVERFPKYREKVYTLLNPYNIEEILKKGRSPVEDYTFPPHTIMSHGRLDYLKNFPRLIKAFSIVRKTVPDAQLLIVGKGPMQPKLETLVADYQLQECVTFLGFRSNPFAYLEKSAVYVLSSYTEGFPNSLVEAMCFVPVVAVDCKSGPREILSDGPRSTVSSGIEIADYGILVKPASDLEWYNGITEDDQLLADAILALFQSEQLYQTMQERARQRVGCYSYSAYEKRLREVLE